MPNTFFVSDTHFGHHGVCRFLRNDGSKLRPWDDPAAMDAALIKNWNSVVGPNDKVYHLGDVVINRRALPTMLALNGKKCLIKGNHDIFRLDEYSTYFYDVRAYKHFDDMMLSHIPMHKECIGRFGTNVHGHLHANNIPHPKFPGRNDPDFFNVSVEQIDFTPISIDVLRDRIKENKKLFA
jgi:calcineurin-like phosphoesterase family protein